MQAYERYKDSGIEWLGEIPEHWKVKRIREIATLFGRIGFRGYNQSDLVDEGEGCITISPSNIIEDSMFFEKNSYLSWTKYFESPEIMIFENDILIVKTGSTVGKVGIVKGLTERATINPQLLVLKNIRADNNYIYRYLYTGLFYDFIKSNAIGSTIPTISETKIGNLPVIFPPLPEQQAITAFLDEKCSKIDEAVRIKQQQIEKLKELRQITIHNAVTKGINPNAEMRDSGIDWIGEIPRHWEVKRLKNLGYFINGYAFDSNDFKNEGVKVLKISNIQTMSIDWSDLSYVDKKFYDNLGKYRVLKGDLVFALTRPIISTGVKATLVNTDEQILINQRNSILRSSKDFDIKWLYFILLDTNFIQEFDNNIDKTGQQPNISTYKIGNIPVPFPSKETINKIISHLEAHTAKIDEAIARKTEQIAKLKEYKQSLINEVVTGKVKVTN